MAGGRPTKYSEKLLGDLKKVTDLLVSGVTDGALAEYFGVSRDTIDRWKKKYPEFSDTIKKAKEDRNTNVEAALYQRAVGYSHPEDKIFNNNGEAMYVETTKHYPPDTAAAFIWLKNRQPDRWRDKHEVEHNGSITVVFDESAKDV